MAFCSKCGQPVADGVGFCPACGTPVGAAPQQAQPNFGYAQAPVKEKLDTIPSSASANFPIFAYIGMAGYVLSLICSFIPTLSYSYGIISLIASLCTLAGMFMFYDALKKGLVGHKAPLTGLCSAAGWLLLASSALAIITILITYIFARGGSFGGSFISILVGGALTIIVSIAYAVVAIILAAKLMGNYEGEVNKLGMWLLILAIVGVLSAIPYLGTIAGAAIAVLMFLTAIKVISPNAKPLV